MYKAIFLDLDGTLLDDNKNVSEKNKEAIQYAEEKGAIVCLCTGRQSRAAKKFKKMADVKGRYLISANGSEIEDLEEKEVLFSSNLDKDLCKNLYNLAQEKECLIRIDTVYGRYINNLKYTYFEEFELNEDIDKFLNENNVIQITIAVEGEKEIDKIINYISKLNRTDIKIENRYKIQFFNLWAINVINVNASKGNAIYGLCKYLKIDPKDVIAMGDDLNDISMLKTAGLGVAMGNAMEEVKAVAKEITKTNNENGVAETIKLYI